MTEVNEFQFGIAVAGVARRECIDRMLQDRLREFSAFDGGTPDAQGRFDSLYLDTYWQEEGCGGFGDESRVADQLGHADPAFTPRVVIGA